MNIIAPIRQLKDLVTVRRMRLLPAAGEVLPVLSDYVRIRDVVAHSTFSNHHVMLDAGPALGMAPKQAAKLLQREVGEYVEKGSILAGKQGFARRILRSPVDGQVAAIRESQILLQVQESSAKLHARIPGKVVEIYPDRGVFIQFVGSWIEGVWGNGQFDDGDLSLLHDDPAQALTADDLDMSMRSLILVAGYCNQRAALEQAQEIPIRGLILGSLDTRLLPIAEQMEYPILLTEGFGTIPMNSSAFQLLRSHSTAHTSLNAQIWDEYAGLRPEIFVPIDDAGQPPQSIESQPFRVGLRVRVLTNPYQGKVGQIGSMLPASTLFPSGIRAAAAEVLLEDGIETVLPLANLEVLG
jgi:hypothetical protein